MEGAKDGVPSKHEQQSESGARGDTSGVERVRAGHKDFTREGTGGGELAECGESASCADEHEAQEVGPLQPPLPNVGVDSHKMIVHSTSYKGPLPDPITLDGYGRVDPSFPERIVRMAEKSLDTTIESQKSYNRIVTITALSASALLSFLVLSCTAIAIFGAVTGRPVTALLSGLIPLAYFLKNILTKQKENDDQ